MRVCHFIAGIALFGCGSVRGSAREAPAARGELRVWTTRAIATVLGDVGPEFERASGYRLRLMSDLPPAFMRRAVAGDPFDVLISGSTTVDEWIRAGRVRATTRTDLARSGIGLAVRSGNPKPDIGSVDAFRRVLLGAQSIAYLRVGSGLYLDSLFKRLGVADPIANKARRPEGDSVAILVSRGEVDFGLVVVTQILTTPGVDLAGPLPPAIQSYITFTAPVSSGAAAPDVGERLITFLRSPAAARAIRARGMEIAPF